MAFTPYLHFQGNCEAAMRFYEGLFGGDLQIMRYRDAPDGGAGPGGDAIMHSCLTPPDGDSLMGSDFPPGESQAAVSVARTVPDVDEGSRLFEALASGGEVAVAFGPTFWSPGFGMLRDRFGTHWILWAAPE